MFVKNFKSKYSKFQSNLDRDFTLPHGTNKNFNCQLSESHLIQIERGHILKYLNKHTLSPNTSWYKLDIAHGNY